MRNHFGDERLAEFSPFEALKKRGAMLCSPRAKMHREGVITWRKWIHARDCGPVSEHANQVSIDEHSPAESI